MKRLRTWGLAANILCGAGMVFVLVRSHGTMGFVQLFLVLALAFNVNAVVAWVLQRLGRP